MSAALKQTLDTYLLWWAGRRWSNYFGNPSKGISLRNVRVHETQISRATYTGPNPTKIILSHASKSFLSLVPACVQVVVRERDFSNMHKRMSYIRTQAASYYIQSPYDFHYKTYSSVLILAVYWELYAPGSGVSQTPPPTPPSPSPSRRFSYHVDESNRWT